LLLLTLVVVIALVGVTLGVDGFTDFEGRVLQSFESFFDLFDVLADDSLVQSGDVAGDLILDVLRDTGGVLLQLLLGVVDVLISLILDVDDLLSGLVRLLSSLGLLDHALDIVIGKTTAGTDGNLLSLTS